jgi:hypothetical protein
MKTLTTVSLIFLLFTKISLADVESTILRDQCKSDVRALITELSPNITDGLDEGIDKAYEKIKTKHPNRFTTTKAEEEALAKNEHIVSREDFLKRIKALKVKSSNPLFPKMLTWYEDIEAKSGLNPAQRVIAVRLVDDALRKIKERDEIQKRIKK